MKFVVFFSPQHGLEELNPGFLSAWGAFSESRVVVIYKACLIFRFAFRSNARSARFG
jgi:hypothetical protein